MRMAVSCAEADADFAGPLVRALIERGVDVVTDCQSVAAERDGWGISKLELIERAYAQDIDYCIVLMTDSFQREASGWRHTKLLELVLERRGVLLPVRVGDFRGNIRGVSGALTEIRVPEGKWEVVLERIVAKAMLSERMVEEVIDDGDISPVLQSYRPAQHFDELERMRNRSARIGFQLVVSHDTLLGRSLYFLYLHRAINLQQTAAYVSERFGDQLRGSDLIVLLPKERGQIIRTARLDNVRKEFNASSVHYVDEFLWKHCTPEKLRDTQDTLDVPAFIDPHVRGVPSGTALTQAIEWYRSDRHPVLVLYGPGGSGKTTLARMLGNEIIAEGYAQVHLVDGQDFVRYLATRQEAGTIDEFFSVYHAYLAHMLQGERGQADTMSRELFHANLAHGNIVLIVDGLDEIIARFGSGLSGERFLQSMTDDSLLTASTKLVVTCRTRVLDVAPEDRRALELELLPFTQEQATKYFEAVFPGMPNQVRRGLDLAQQLTRDGAKVEFIPFVLDVVGTLLRERLDDSDDTKGDPAFDSNILAQALPTDYTIGRICAREVLKYPLGFNTDDQIRCFVHLAYAMRGFAPANDLRRFLETALDRPIDGSQIEVLLRHPLLSADEKQVRFRYDLLLTYFQSLAISLLFKREIALDKQMVDLLAERADMESVFGRECVSRLDRKSEDVALVAVELIEGVRKLANTRMEWAARAVSALFTVALLHSDKCAPLSRASATALMKDMFASGRTVVGCALYGGPSRAVFDFSNLVVDKASFVGFQRFWECGFSRETSFRNCVLVSLGQEHPVRTEARRENFDLETCRVDDSVLEVIAGAEDEQSRTLSTASQDVRHFLRQFYRQGRILGQKEDKLRAKYRGRARWQDVADVLRNAGIVTVKPSFKEKLLGREWEVTADVRQAVLQFCTQGITPLELRRAIRQLAGV